MVIADLEYIGSETLLELIKEPIDSQEGILSKTRLLAPGSWSKWLEVAGLKTR